MLNFQIKICGITNAKDAQAAQAAGADSIGLNFYSRSLRSVKLEKAAAIVDAIDDIVKVGVFVNEDVDRTNELATQLGLDLIQLHGDETPEMITKLKSPVMRAIRVMDGDFDAAKKEVEIWQKAGGVAVLLDTGSRKQFGGTGTQLDWDHMSKQQFGVPGLPELPLVLAGGLNCDNVAQAIRQVRPSAVDVASGIEKFPGVKDHDLMRQYIESARTAFDTSN